MEQTYLSWAMVLIGSGAVVAGVTGFLLPERQRLSVALPLLIGAGVGVTAMFLQALVGGFDDPEISARTFLLSSVSGFVAVLAGLGVLFARARASRG